jgi:hypothetical protein
MTHADVFIIYYGSWSTSQAATTMALLNYFVAHLNGSAWYSINR